MTTEPSAPLQIMVPFEAFPELEATALQAALSSEETSCRVEPRELFDGEPDTRVEALVASFDELLHVTLLAFDRPMDDALARRTLGAPATTDGARAALAEHRAYLELTAVGQAEPLEEYEALYRVAAAALDLGGLGVANPQTWAAYRSSSLEPIFEAEDAWRRLRDEGVPAEILVGFLTLHADDRRWAMTRGMHVFGFPELAFHADREMDAFQIRSIFNNIFYYLVERGPVLEDGHTMEMAGREDARMAFRLPEGEDEAVLVGEVPTLILEIG
jgi:hypothetical protein